MCVGRRGVRYGRAQREGGVLVRDVSNHAVAALDRWAWVGGAVAHPMGFDWEGRWYRGESWASPERKRKGPQGKG
jgi:hypothetical protein